MKIGLVFKSFSADFRTKKEAVQFLMELEKVCNRYDSKADTIDYSYEFEGGEQ
jgi:hypothetical protein